MAFVMYKSDYDEVGFTNITCGPGAGACCTRCWIVSLNPYIKNWQMTRCPSEYWDRTWANTAFITAAGIPNPLQLSYAMNMHMNYPQCGAPNTNRDPASTVVFGDGMWLTIFCGNSGPNCTWAAYNAYIRFRHNGGANFAFEDGHAKWYTDGNIRSDTKMWGCPKYP